MDQNQKYCDICGEDFKGVFYGKGSKYNILQCPNCDLIWSDPLTTKNFKETIDSDYWAEDVYIKEELAQKARFRKQLTKILKLDKNFKEKKILDIGSGLGFFLDVCEEKGFTAEGCDINQNAVKYCNREKVRSRVGSIDSFYKDNSFDVVFAFNLIEHLPHPKEFLLNCKRILKDDGVLILETPTQNSLFHKFARLGDKLTGYKLNYYGVNSDGHIHKFCNKTFEILKQLGFEIVINEKINSPINEILGKTAYLSAFNKYFMRISVPIVWFFANLLGQQNRAFIVLKVKNSD
ncbi:MAG: class I SAM-dependent methyltransferase [Candidatus Delongbacteria bacterium]|jgi:SAM-dependent methyltransferase|nr:class I SAM-dependent methyltransferase [Candidatus Delongbacteria bacterium]